MALQKHKNDQFGNGGYNYWRIIETNINWASRSSHVSLAGYLTQEARQNDKQPMEVVSFDWSGENFPFDLPVLDGEGMNAVKVSYEKIKESKLDDKGEETNWFADAEDV